MKPVKQILDMRTAAGGVFAVLLSFSLLLSEANADYLADLCQRAEHGDARAQHDLGRGA